jgi:LytS/YehU family sensor histidine kinase
VLGVWYTIRFLKIDNKKTWFLFNHILIAIIFLSVWILLSEFIVSLFVNENSVYNAFIKNAIPYHVITGIVYYILTILIYYLLIYYHSFKEKLTKEASLRTLVKETELSLLKSQINPHFIFNTLNSISSLTITNPPLAQEMVIKLSSFLRFALEKNSRNLVSLSEELDNALLYLEIEKTRFGDKLIINTKIDNECKEMKIPNLLLQPLLENAVKYGVYESTAPINIRLYGSKKDSFLHLTISNNFDPSSVPKKGKGIGIKNVKERLYLIYGKQDLLKTTIENSYFEINLYIPQTEEA